MNYDTRESYRRELSERFRKNIQAHLDGDVEFIIDDIGEGFFSMSEAEIKYPTKEDQRSRFTEYLSNTTFTEYRSLGEPEFGFSEDCSLAWGNYRVRVSGSSKRPDGSDGEFSFDCAWLWLFRRAGGRWMRVGEVSTWK